MEQANAFVNKKLAGAKGATKGGKLRPKRSHFFYVLIVVCGWLLPPLAILVRFGIGFDFFLNILLTICGYIPGHGHNFYCQNIRNNKTKARTPRWAVRAGLVEVKDPRGGRHQWANRYDGELHLAQSAAATERGADAVPGQEWDGRGPEPARVSGKLNSGGRKHHGLAPWDNVVDDDEVEGEPEGGLWRDGENLAPVDSRGSQVRGNRRQNEPDPLENEQFYPSAGDSGFGGSGSALARTGSAGSRKKSSKMGGLLGKHRDRYAAQPSAGTSSSDLAARRDSYQDDFEREINEGSRPSRREERFDTFDAEGPEDAWASARPPPVGSSRRQEPVAPAKPKQSEADFLNHTF
ncbi:YqaE/Pmp3 family membrane protein [Sporobolomyces salmoneus]|uniref:YqaE/Pmp3 family membrane protein n=1 Tax=Sporobolomyces salmoneus TaxID=183962 RepID=UPI00316B7358